MTTLMDAASKLQHFANGSARNKLLDLERDLRGPQADKATLDGLNGRAGVDIDLLNAALEIKRAAKNINDVIRATGILLVLPYILSEGETVESVALAGGQNVSRFDLETNQRVGEFNFANWKVGAENVRQNVFFKDFFALAEAQTDKQRFMYVIGEDAPMRFLTGGRSLKSVLKDEPRLAGDMQRLYGDGFTLVREYYEQLNGRVQIVDVTRFVPEFAEAFAEEGR
jgi:hypothetical protein